MVSDASQLAVIASNRLPINGEFGTGEGEETVLIQLERARLAGNSGESHLGEMEAEELREEASTKKEEGLE